LNDRYYFGLLVSWVEIHISKIIEEKGEFGKVEGANDN